ncbi:Lipoteichoic acid synthase LtaS Type IIc [Streptococcus gallolyticus]|uniref:Lipoteichoic acid synthase LtaS Type IIc n=1 Tax=Streptococcus gallolyticus TaxID=315405 RepID=A0A139MWZ4_9STRE|nr:LTA synthase family protein [Streptococcus gallolyticus]KXT68041.1 Lipoteichoic acid synthase LtaS Type IIc [Streptococcus gallolyticus]
MKEKVKNAFLEVNWPEILHKVLLVIFVFYISLAIVGCNILIENKVSNNFIVIKHFFIVSGILSSIGFSIYLVHYLSLKNALRLFWSYVTYLPISYFLLVTRNINNEDFKIWNFGKNHFFEYRGLILVIFVIVLALLVKRIVDTCHLQKQFNSFFQDYHYSESPFYYLIVLLVIADSKLIAIFSNIVSSTIIDENISKFVSQLAINLFLTFVAFYFIIRFTFQAFNALKKNEPNFSLVITASLLLALIFNYTIQLGVKINGSLMDMYIFPGATLYQIICIAILNVLIFIIFNRFLISFILASLFWVTISIANYIKYDMRNEPLLISDFIWIKDMDLIFSYIDTTIVIYVSVAFIAVILFYIKLRSKILTGKIFNQKRYRATSFAFLAIIITSFYSIFVNSDDGKIIDDIPVVSQLNNNYNVFWLGNSTHSTYRSLLYVWTKQVTSKAMDKPEGYSKSRVEEIVQKYTDLADEINQNRTEEISDQTVIYILSESFADPNLLSAVSLNQDIIPNIRQISSETTSGLMKSDGYGGGTANMEFQTLTSLPMYNFSSSISTLTNEVIPLMSNIPSLSSEYYSENRIAVHLGDALTYSRSTMYNKLGFETFIARENGTENISDAVFVGDYPSDESTYNTVIDNINPSVSQFFSVITYQNHVPWDYNDESVIAEGVDFTDEENSELTNFSSLLSVTDSATQSFLNELAQIDKKITVVFYGDHLPGFYPNSTFEDSPEQQYQTNYFIWSNYQANKLDYPYVNSSDFTSLLLAHTNSKVSPYYALFTEVLNNASIDKEELTDEQQKIADDLKIIQYDLTVGKGYINDYENFFEFD